MNRTFFSIFVALLLLSVPVLLLLSLPVLAVEETSSEDVPQSAEAEFDVLHDPEKAVGEGQYEQLYAELVQLRANTDYIFLGVIAMSGVVLGCFVGITMIRLWGT